MPHDGRAVQAEGFSPAMIDRFFRPFLGGIFFDRGLSVTSRLFTFVMRVLATGLNCLPAAGIGAVPKQLAAPLYRTRSIKVNSPVAAVSPETETGPACVTLADEARNRIVARKGVVIATDGPAASRLLAGTGIDLDADGSPGVGTACVYFSATKAPRTEPILYLDGDGGRLVNNCCFPSTVAPSYAPPGRTLVSASTIGTHDELSDEELAEVRRITHSMTHLASRMQSSCVLLCVLCGPTVCIPHAVYRVCVVQQCRPDGGVSRCSVAHGGVVHSDD